MRTLVLSILILTFSASSPAGLSPVDAPLPAAGTPDELVAQFEQAMNDRQIDVYASLLHPDFEFVFAPRDRHRVEPDRGWGRDEELRAMRRLFSGEPGTFRPGQPMPGVSRIEFALVAADDWSYEFAERETWTRSFHAFAKFFLEDGSRRLITRQQVLTVTAQRNEWNLQPAGFQMLRWEEVGCDCPADGSPRMAKSRF